MELNSYTDLERINPSSHRNVQCQKSQAISRAGHAVHVAVIRFITIGELIADDNPEIKSDMYSFCRDARNAGKSIDHLCELSAMDDMDYLDLAKAQYDHTDIVLASRSLLSSITRVLLLVDIVVVKQLLTARRKITKSLEKLESIMNFAEFVRAFSIFGLEMIELAYLTGSQQNRLKEERHRAQMFSARQMLEHSITLLITSSHTSLVHGECVIAKENRDTVFCQIRRAMDLIHYVIKDSIFESDWYQTSGHHHHHQQHHHPSLGFKNGENGTVFTTLKQLNYLMDNLREECKMNENSNNNNNNSCAKLKSYDKSWFGDCINHQNQDHQHYTSSTYQGRWDDCGGGGVAGGVRYRLPSWLDAETIPLYNYEVKEQLLMTFEKLLEKTHDFTDSPYTSHMHRENILLHCDRCKLEFNKYFNKSLKSNQYNIDNDIDSVLIAVKNLSRQLVLAIRHQAAELNHSLNMSINCLEVFRAAAIQQNLTQDFLEEQLNRFHDYSDYIIDVCKLLQHIAFTETLQVQVKCLAINLRIYGPQILTAMKIFFKYSDSEAAKENFEAFAKMWKFLTTEMNTLAKQVVRTTSSFGAHPRSEIYNPTEPFDLATYSLAKAEPTVTAVASAAATGVGAPGVVAAGVGAANPADVAEGVENERNKFDDINNIDNNDILKRAKNMSAMAFSMYQFTKGSGTLKTTQDLFTQAEYFAEEANRLYKVLRQFSYQVPASPNKKDLLDILDRVPTFVQTLQFTVKEHTVGKAATFVKVDHVIKETKELMSVINNVVTKCFECADKFKLDFTGITGDIAACSSRGDDCSGSGMGDSKTTSTTEGSM